MTALIYSVLFLSFCGLLFGAVISLVNLKFGVKKDIKTEKITQALPGYNCGACGYAGCAALAEAITKGEAPPDACPPGGSATADKIYGILNIESKKKVPQKASLLCNGFEGRAADKYEYEGEKTCAAAAMLSGGPKACPYGCISFGDCEAACPFDAIKIIHGKPEVDYIKCTGCGICVKACPKNVLRLLPEDKNVFVRCVTLDKPKEAKQYCDVSCIHCRLCEKACPVEEKAIKLDTGKPVINYELCIDCGKCADACPRACIEDKKAPRGKSEIIE